jgi:DNA-binding MarR family transcriptional regulator
VCIARDPSLRLREIADCVGVTERTAHKVVDDLVEAGYVKRFREGNRNRYEVVHDVPMSHPVVEDHWIGEILAVLATRSLRGFDRDVGANGNEARSARADRPPPGGEG